MATTGYSTDEFLNSPSSDSSSPMTVHSLPVSYDNSHLYPFPPGLIPAPPLRTKRRQVKNACTKCQKACKKCDDVRPCLRCIRYGLTDECVDSKRKERRKGIKRGPYKKRDDKGIPLDRPTVSQGIPYTGVSYPSNVYPSPYHHSPPSPPSKVEEMPPYYQQLYFNSVPPQPPPPPPSELAHELEGNPYPIVQPSPHYYHQPHTMVAPYAQQYHHSPSYVMTRPQGEMQQTHQVYYHAPTPVYHPAMSLVEGQK